MKKAAPWLVLIVLLLAAGTCYVLRRPAATHPSVVALEESDAAMVGALDGLVGAERLDTWFVTEQLISRIVATVDSLTSREIAPLVLPLKPVPGPFQVASDGEAVTISPDNAARYAQLVQMVAALDTEQAVALYTRFYPLFQEAYEALGYPGEYFNDRLVEVIDHLLATPEVSGPIRLVKPEAVYLYADPALESLSAGQKLLLRMGGENAALIRAKLREYRAAITRQDP
jgi:hypothetical protein